MSGFIKLFRERVNIPDTWMVPPKTYEPTPDLKPTLSRYAKLFDVRRIGDRIGWPMFIKPHDGGGWRGSMRTERSVGRRCV